MGESALLIDMGVDEVPDLVGSLLGLSCCSTSQYDDVVVDEVDLVSHSVHSVHAS